MPAACASPVNAWPMRIALLPARFSSPYVSYAISTGVSVTPQSSGMLSNLAICVSTTIWQPHVSKGSAIDWKLKTRFHSSVAVVLLAATLTASGPVWREAIPGYHYQFPRDHFEHQDFRTEWWYYTGNVADAQGKRFGFELVFFRQGQNRATDNQSVWAVKDLYLAHAALTDIDGKYFWYDE